MVGGRQDDLIKLHDNHKTAQRAFSDGQATTIQQLNRPMSGVYLQAVVEF